MSKTLSLIKQLKITGISTIIFLCVTLSLVYNVIGWLIGLFGIKTTTITGCPNIYSIILHSLIFGIIIFVIMITNTIEKYDGLANPAGMMKYNTAYLEAEDANCSECINACKTCISDPYNKDCQESIETCLETCDNKKVIDSVQDAYISTFNNY